MWLLPRLPQAAAVSGLELARALSSLRGVPMTDAALSPFRRGLSDVLRPVAGGSDLGQFPRAATTGTADASRLEEDTVVCVAHL